MAEEFDSYAIKYDALLSDPLREGFADTEFFHVRKLDLLLDFLRRMGKPPSNLAWLDVGCGRVNSYNWAKCISAAWRGAILRPAC